MIALVLTPLSAGVAQGPPPDRPDPPPSRPDNPPDRSDPPPTIPVVPGLPPSAGAQTSCPSVHGFVLNWGYQNEPRIPVNLNGASWRTQHLTDDNGLYASECLGWGIALLNLSVAPPSQPMTTDVAVRLGYRESLEVNLGLYGSNIVPTPPVTPQMTANTATARPGDLVIYTLTLANPALKPDGSAGTTMEAVMATVLFPPELIPVSMNTSTGTLELWGQLVTANAGSLSAGQTATITITARIEESIPADTIIACRASLLYQDNVATQTSPVTVKITSASTLPAAEETNQAPSTLPVTGAGD